ncbi:anaerobic C4-dicarboxylate transporter family protein [Arcticibacter eurypsychrophilus]|uniref:anaerobic C4-dicarboxylate transporter family protein n=1 Tax=Arcticibacter eurypsychrophilus TaxID=1434752 RepID=UPI00084D3F37|nr:anaerobic C4-dicarboxylate transporter [Arcticibacter eurypsychrophilus]
MFYFELLVVLAAIFVGARIGGIGLGVMGAVGLVILTFGFNLEPTTPPIDVMLIIIAVISASAALQASQGLAYMVALAEKMLRKNPKRITFVAPLVCYIFTFVAGTGHIAYSILPIISELATKTGIRPERPLSVSVIASQQAITASPITAATVALAALLAPQGIEIFDILKISIPATLIGVLISAFIINKIGVELKDDPIFNEKLKDPDFVKMINEDAKSVNTSEIPGTAKISVLVFLTAVFVIVLFGAIPSLRPSWEGENGVMASISMVTIIEMVMMSAAALILLISKVKVSTVSSGNIFKAGNEAVIAIFGVAWMGDTFIKGNYIFIESGIKEMVLEAPWTFAIALFVMSILLFSQAATIRAMMPLGVALGIPAGFLIAMFPSVNGYFFIPNYPTIIAAIGFDKTGTTRIGKYVLNHSFMLPGIISTVTAVAIGFLMVFLFGI